MRIKEIVYSQRNKDKCTIVFEDGSELKSFTSLVIRFDLFPGRDVEDEQRRQLVEESAAAGAKAKAVEIAARGQLSRAMLEKKLTDRGNSKENASAAADWLEELGAIDDKEYSDLLVRHYASRGYGERRIREELRRRGIDRELWDEAVQKMPDVEEKLNAFIAKRLSVDETDKASIKKVSDALLRRGYSWDEVKSAIRRYLNDSPED